MYIKMHDGNFVVADVYPHAAPDADPRFLATSAHFAVMPEGDVLFNAQPVTVEGIAKEAGEMILAVMQAERIAGREADYIVLEALAFALIELTK